jgi:hypothetical protein
MTTRGICARFDVIGSGYRAPCVVRSADQPTLCLPGTQAAERLDQFFEFHHGVARIGIGRCANFGALTAFRHDS